MGIKGEEWIRGGKWADVWGANGDGSTVVQQRGDKGKKDREQMRSDANRQKPWYANTDPKKRRKLHWLNINWSWHTILHTCTRSTTPRCSGGVSEHGESNLITASLSWQSSSDETHSFIIVITRHAVTAALSLQITVLVLIILFIHLLNTALNSGTPPYTTVSPTEAVEAVFKMSHSNIVFRLLSLP